MLYQAAWQGSAASADGHVCACLADIAAVTPGWTQAQLRACLLASAVVGTPEVTGAMPLILA